MKRFTDSLLKLLISLLFILLTMQVSAQSNIILKGDTLILNNHAKFWINEEVIFGSGTMPDKSYSYIYFAPNSLQKLISDRRKKLLSPGYKGYKSKVVKFEKEIGHNKKNYDYSIIVLEMPDGKRYWCDVANAFNNYEIVLKSSENNNAQVTKSEVNKNDTNNLNKKKLNGKKINAHHVTKSKVTTIF